MHPVITLPDLAHIAQLAADRTLLRASVLVDDGFVVRWASPSSLHLLGWEPDDLVGQSALAVLHPDDVEVCGAILAFEATIDPTIRLDMSRRAVREIRVRRPDGTYRVLEVALTNFFDDPEIGMLYLDLAATDQNRMLEAAIECSQSGGDVREVLELILSQFTSADPWQPAAAIFDANGAFLAGSANAPEPFGPKPPASFRTTWSHDLRDVGDDNPLGVVRFWCHLPSAHPLDLEMSERTARYAALILGRDNTRRELERAATSDPLTGVANRRALERDLSRRAAGDERVAMAYVDLNGFKRINDTYGHAAGDQVLATIAQRLSASVRIDDLVARVGGDEFVVLFADSRQERESVIRRITALVRRPILWGDVALEVSEDRLLQAADHEMLAAKPR
jgi:diguanylate cyclase (GGDEF)-like protein